MTSPCRQGCAALASAALALAGWFYSPVASATAPAEDAGDAALVADSRSTRRIDKGGSATRFSIRLPIGASCPGDSANDGYRVQSFMAPAVVAAPEIEFDGLGPAPISFGNWETFRQPLYDIGTSPLDSGFTAVAAAPGQPGPIVDLPVFTFGVFGPGELPPGRYRIGIACTLANQLVKFWDNLIQVNAQPDDKPGQFSWLVADDSSAATGSAGSPSALIVAGGLVTLAVVIAYSRQRLRSRSSGIPVEDR